MALPVVRLVRLLLLKRETTRVFRGCQAFLKIYFQVAFHCSSVIWYNATRPNQGYHMKLSELTAKDRNALADKLKSSRGYFYQIATGRRAAGGRLALRIVQACPGLKLEDLLKRAVK